MKTNKVVVVIAFLLAAGVGFAQGARGMGGGGISGQPIDGTVIKPRSVQASGTQDQFMCTATTAVCEVESNISAATMTSTVPAFDIGPTATPDANDRMTCFSFGPSGSKTRRTCIDAEGDILPSTNNQNLGGPNRWNLYTSAIYDTSDVRISFATNAAASSNAYTDASAGMTTGSVAHIFNTRNTYPTGNKLMSVRNAGVERFYIEDDGDTNMNSLAVGMAPSGIRAHFLTEGNTIGTYQPTNFDDKFAVFGRAATSGVNSGGVFLTYHFGDNEGVIGALSPTTAWRPLSFPASEWKFRPNGSGAIANITNTGAFNSAAASGNQAFTCTNVGCRLSLGNTGRYIMDAGNGTWSLYAGLNVFSTLTADTISDANGIGPLNLTSSVPNGASAVGVVIRSTPNYTTAGAKIASFRNTSSNEVAFVDKDGIVSGNSFVATTASGSALTGGGASGGLLLTSNADPAWTSVTNAAITVQASQDLVTGADKIFAVKNSAGTTRFSVDQYGSVWIGDGTNRQVYSRYFFANSTPIEIGTYMTPGAEKNPMVMFTNGNFTADDVNLWSLHNNGSTKVATFSKDGLLRVNKSNAAKPTCNADNRGRVFYLDGAAGVADTYEICMKNTADAYAWKTIVTP